MNYRSAKAAAGGRKQARDTRRLAAGRESVLRVFLKREKIHTKQRLIRRKHPNHAQMGIERRRRQARSSISRPHAKRPLWPDPSVTRKYFVCQKRVSRINVASHSRDLDQRPTGPLPRNHRFARLVFVTASGAGKGDFLARGFAFISTRSFHAARSAPVSTSSSAAARRIWVCPIFPQPPGMGRKISGASVTNSACCSSVSCRLP